MEVKVTLEAGQSLIDLVNTLLRGLSRQITPATTPASEKKTKKQPKSEPAIESVLETTEEATTEPDLKTPSSEDVIDYGKLRAEVRAVAAQKKAAGADIKTVLKKYGGKLSAIADADLPAVKAEIEAL